MQNSHYLTGAQEEELRFEGQEDSVALNLVNIRNNASLNFRNLSKLKILVIGSNINSISNFPNSLEKLAISSDNITQLPEFNDGLENLVIECPRITQLNQLPKSLKKLRISNSSITALPDGFPLEDNNLVAVDLSNMTSLEANLENFNKLSRLEEIMTSKNLDCTSIWPPQFNQFRDGSFLLKTAYCMYRSSDPNFSVSNVHPNPNFPTYFLTHRFFTESNHNCRAEIKDQIYQLGRKIVRNPNILETLDEVASGFLAGCVNQPVAGFIEIATLVDIDECKSVTEKLEKSKILMAINIVRDNLQNFKDSQGNQVSQTLEIELFNALLIKVHSKLYEQNKITQKWSQIPSQISYGNLVERFLDEEKITELVKKIDQEILQIPLNDIANYMCETSYQDFWATQFLTKEQRVEIAEPLNNLQREFLELDQISESQLRILEETKIKCHSQILQTAKQICYQKLANETGLDLSQSLESRATSIDLNESRTDSARSRQSIDETTRPATSFDCSSGVASLFSRFRTR